MDVLQWRYEGQVCVLHGNLGIYHQGDQLLLVPDLCVFKGRAYEPILSWKIGQTGPPPQVVFEIASQGTWERDVDDKPQLYAQMRVKEYFLYDPSLPPVMKDMPRLLGWKRNSDGEMEALVRHEDDWLWSQQLESYLGADGEWLRLYDNRRQLRLTEAEARKHHEQILEQHNDALAREKQRAKQKQRLAEQCAQALAEKLRALGINPDDLA